MTDDRRPASPPDALIDPVTEASLQSFPASDPPSFNPGEAAPQPSKPMLPRDLLHAF